MKRTLLSIAIGAITLLQVAAAGAMSNQFPEPKVDYSADMTMVMNQKNGGQPHVIKGKLYSSDGKERREFKRSGRSIAVISDRRKGTSHTLMKEQKMYMAHSENSREDPQQMLQDGKMTFKAVGKEKKKGLLTTKFKMTSTDKAEEKFEGYAWLTKQNIPVLIMATSWEGGRSYDIQIDYDNISIKKQAGHLFTIPSNYRPVQTGLPMGAPTGPGGGEVKLPAGLTPEQIEQLKKIMQQKKGG